MSDQALAGRGWSMPRATAAMLLIVTTVMSLFASMLALPSARADGEGCTPVEVIAVPGTWETSESDNPDESDGMLKGVTDPLTAKYGNKLHVYYAPYMARAFDNGHTINESVQSGLKAVGERIQQVKANCPGTRFALTGFSQGAWVAGDIINIASRSEGGLSADDIIGASLLADPRTSSGGNVGLASSRPGGFGKLESLVKSFCAVKSDGQKDLYCSGGNGSGSGAGQLISSIGRVLSGVTTGSDTDKQFAGSDYSKVDLPNLAANTQKLFSMATSGSSPQDLLAQAQKTAETIIPVSQTADTAKKNPEMTESLQKSDSAEQKSAVQTLSSMDWGSAASQVNKIISTVTGVVNGGGSAANVTSDAADLNATVQPITSVSGALSTASSVLSVIEPQSILNMLTTAVTSATDLATSFPDVLKAISEIPGVITSPDDIPTKVKKSHEIFNRITKILEPVVTFIAGLDFSMIGKIVAIVPDPSGFTQIAGIVLTLLNNLDVVGLYNNIKQLFEQMWHALETGDVLGAAVGAIAPATKLVTIAVGTLTGGTKTDAKDIGKVTAPTDNASLTAAVQKGDLSAIASTLSNLVGGDFGETIKSVLGAGLNIASFFNSGAHTDYASNGDVQRASDWLDQKIGAVINSGTNTTKPADTSDASSDTPATTTTPAHDPATES